MPAAPDLILAIDTSCDDTAAAVTQGTTVLSNVIASQTQLHKPYGGVFPTVAKQAHAENIVPTISVALKRAGVRIDDISTLAVTLGPGLAPALEIGIAHIKQLATETGLPIIPVNHIHGHLFSSQAVAKQRGKKHTRMQHEKGLQTEVFNSKKKQNILGIIVSGGHTEFIRLSGNHKSQSIQILGRTLDDAAGECLDKIGRMLNLGYPAGPIIEELARNGDPMAYHFPLPLTHKKTFDMSFSGLKTHTRNLLKTIGGTETLTKSDVSHFAASAQYAVFKHITYKLDKLLESQQFDEIWLGGGVAINTTLRRMIRETIHKHTNTVTNPKLQVPYTRKLCMDNAAMIGVAAALSPHTKRFATAQEHELLQRIPRWRADELLALQ